MARIQVKLKSTGQTGTLDESEFDPNVFERVGNTPQNSGFLKTLSSLGETFFPRLSQWGKDVSGGSVMRGLLPRYEESFNLANDQADRLLALAKKTTDPTKRTALLQAAGEANKEAQRRTQDFTGQTNELVNAGVGQHSGKGTVLDYMRQGLGVGVEVAPWLAGGNWSSAESLGGKVAEKTGKAILKPMISMGGTGALVSGLYGLSDPTSQSVGESLTKGFTGGAIGGATGAGIGAAGHSVKALGRYLLRKAPQSIIARAFPSLKPTSNQNMTDITDEVLEKQLYNSKNLDKVYEMTEEALKSELKGNPVMMDDIFPDEATLNKALEVIDNYSNELGGRVDPEMATSGQKLQSIIEAKYMQNQPLDATDLLELKRIMEYRYPGAPMEEIATQKIADQKAVADMVRGALKEAYPEAADLLDTQQASVLMREALEKTQAQGMRRFLPQGLEATALGSSILAPAIGGRPEYAIPGLATVGFLRASRNPAVANSLYNLGNRLTPLTQQNIGGLINKAAAQRIGDQ